MSAIHDLIAQVTYPRLRDRLAAEWAKVLPMTSNPQLDDLFTELAK